MRRFVRIKQSAEKPQATLIQNKGDAFYPVFLHSTVDQDRAVGSLATFSEHLHDFYHIVLYTKGEGWYSKDGRYWPARPGTCVLIDPGCRHEFVTRRQTAVYSELTFAYESDTSVLTISFAEILSLYSGMDVRLAEDSTLTIDQRQTLYNMLVQITDYLNSAAPPANYYANRTLTHILDFLIEHCARRAVPSDLVDSRLTRVRFWLEEHYLEPVSMDQLAHMAGVTKSYFFRAFKKAFGIPPLAYQQALRIEAAKTLLRATTLSCAEIADRAGFADMCFFHRIFKRHTGLTPKQFRRTTER